MKVAIVYGSRSGNTRRIAAAISDALSGEAEVELMEAETARMGAGTDLLVVGGPTEGHRRSLGAVRREAGRSAGELPRHDGAKLRDGELERAGPWARSLVASTTELQPAGAR